jgi:hypothetical protein
MVAAPALGWVAFGGSHGRARFVIEGMLAAAFLGTVLWRPDPDARRWLRGAVGEAATASALEGLPAKRWEVFHDLAVPVPGSRSNIDHVAVGPTGVWVIDSKTTRAEVRVGLFSVRFGDRRLDTGPVRWQAGIVGEQLGVKARPVIALHCGLGSGGLSAPAIGRRGVRRGGVRIVMAGDLTRRLRRGRRRLGRADVQVLSGEVRAHFRRYPRSDR